jgi:hypothetical protein
MEYTHVHAEKNILSANNRANRKNYFEASFDL